MKFLYKAIHSLLPCILLTTSVGMIYAFSLFIPEITMLFDVSRNRIQFSFALSIFFLGFGASLFGNLVEKNIKIAAFIAAVMFSTGLYLTHLSIAFRSLSLLYLGVGVFMGIAEGIAYLCPIKNMVLWFSTSRYKGIIMAVSIVSFGLGASICAYLYKFLYPIYHINSIFLVLSVIYGTLMLIGAVLIRKPRYAKQQILSDPLKLNYSALLRDPYFLKHWLFMFLNISMGLILIGNRKNILIDAHIEENTIITVFAICGFSNAFGRLLFPFIGDFFKNKLFMIPLIFIFELLFISPAIAMYSIVPLSIILVEGGYGGMFATAPQILLSLYGSRPLSVVHGLLLSSWACASLFAFMCTTLISLFTPNYYVLTIFLTCIYLLAFLHSLTLEKSHSNIS